MPVSHDVMSRPVSHDIIKVKAFEAISIFWFHFWAAAFSKDDPAVMWTGRA
jgi:hypothetical protein